MHMVDSDLATSEDAELMKLLAIAIQDEELEEELDEEESEPELDADEDVSES